MPPTPTSSTATGPPLRRSIRKRQPAVQEGMVPIPMHGTTDRKWALSCTNNRTTDTSQKSSPTLEINPGPSHSQQPPTNQKDKHSPLDQPTPSSPKPSLSTDKAGDVCVREPLKGFMTLDGITVGITKVYAKSETPVFRPERNGQFVVDSGTI